MSDPLFEYTPPGLDLETIMRDVSNPDNLPAFQVPNDGSGEPQAPWYAPIISAGTAIGIGFANKELYGTPGMVYTGATPYIKLPGGGAIAPGYQGGQAGFTISTQMLMFAVLALGALALYRK